MEDSGKTAWVAVLSENAQSEVSGVFSTRDAARRAVEDITADVEWRDTGGGFLVGRLAVVNQTVFCWTIYPMPLDEMEGPGENSLIFDLLDDRGEV